MMTPMSSVAECRAAIDRASARIAELDEAERRRHIVERTVSVTVRDLETVFGMRLTMSGLEDVTEHSVHAPPTERAQVRITVSSNDLVDLADDRMDVARAMLTGRVKLEASFTDLMRLRKLL